MATYNGERFIRQQLDSLAAQTLLPHELVVCDDRSTDATLSIVQEFAGVAPFPVSIHQNSERLGYSDNFLRAAGLATGEWIAFCDQDDVWLPEKLAHVAAAAKSQATVVLVVHSATVVDPHLRPTGQRFSEIEIGRRRIVGPLQQKIIGR
jgi:glycosyltransferase involved in cell wall biosynthesis